MTDDRKVTGHCLCGAVRITLPEGPKTVGICHCGMCRRWSGGPTLAIEAGKEVEIDGREHIGTYRSSDWAERAFCKVCGCNLYYRLVEAGSYAVCAGLLEDQNDLSLTSQIFIDEKPDFYSFANETTNLTGAEVFALYAPDPEKG